MSAYRKYLKVVRKARKPAVIALWPGYKRRGTWFVIIDYAEKKDYVLELESRLGYLNNTARYPQGSVPRYRYSQPVCFPFLPNVNVCIFP